MSRKVVCVPENGNRIDKLDTHKLSFETCSAVQKNEESLEEGTESEDAGS